MKFVRSWHICVATAATLVAFAPGASATSSDDYANQTPYGTPDASVKTAPKGYSMIFLESVGRHGARSLTNDGPEKAALKLWQRAADEGALTDNGRDFARDVKTFQDAEKQIGYGKLSGLGTQELQGIGRRVTEAYAPFLEDVKKDGDTIATFTTEVERTKQSAEAMHEGGVSVAGDAKSADAKSILAPIVEAEKLLHISSRASSAGTAMTKEILGRDAIRAHAEHLLGTLYTSSYVDGIKDPVDAALDVYKLYSTAPSMAEETDITFGRYVPQQDREPLSYATDAETFYQYGPGVQGETNTFDSARPLLADFFATLDDRIKGSSTAAVLRIAHGETTMPFESLIKVPGSDVQVPKGERFTRQSNAWRGAEAGRMAGNVEWSAFRNDAGSVLVTMRYNEKPIPFNDGCTPYEDGSYFYTVTELKRCLV